MRKLLFFLCLFILTESVCAKHVEYYYTNHLTSSKGLPHSLVFDVTQSQDGFIWVGTNNGLGRYDGYDFKTFRPKEGALNSLSGKSISEMFTGADKQLWLSIQGMGLNRLDLNSYQYHHYGNRVSQRPNTSGNEIICYLESHSGEFYLGTNLGLDKYDAAKDRFDSCIPETSDNKVLKLLEDGNGDLWLRTPTGLKYYNTRTNQLQTLEEKSGLSELEELEVNDFFVSSDNNTIIIATVNNGLTSFNYERNSVNYRICNAQGTNNVFRCKDGSVLFISYGTRTQLNRITEGMNGKVNYSVIYDLSEYNAPLGMNFCEDHKQDIWFSFGEGLFKINDQWNISVIKSQNEEGLLSQNIYASFVDDMNNLWLQSDRNGLIMIDLNQKLFKTYKNHKDQNPIISGKNISMVFEDSKQNIWVGCHSVGITCFNPTENSYTDYLYKPNAEGEIKFRAPAGIAEDERGHIWVGFYDGEMHRINPKTRRVETYTFDTNDGANYFDAHSIRSMVYGKNDNLWIATNTKGLVELDIESGKLSYHSVNYESNFLNNSHYRFVTQSADGLIWTGTQNGGLGKYNPTTHTFKHYLNKPDEPTSISGNTVYCVHEINDSILWIGTDKGLNRFNRQTEEFTNIPTVDGDSFCAVYRIYSDDKGFLWLSGDCGLIKFDQKAWTYVTYKETDGLPGNEFNTTAGCQLSNGQIFFGSSRGLLSFNPSDIAENPYEARPVLTEFRLFNKLVEPGQKVKSYHVLDEAISKTQDLLLPHYLNDFTIEFSSLHFASPVKNKYRYKLLGFNPEWIYTDSNRRWANFTGLEPGDYTFVLQATNNDGLLFSKEKEVRLKISVEPPIYETWWFRLIMIVLVFILIFLIIQFRLKSIKSQKIKLERKVNQRTIELKRKNRQLEASRTKVEEQNEELEQHRFELEELVEKRTKYLKYALRKAEESDRLKTSFLSNMSHEIRTPMNAILGFTEIIREGDLKTDEVESFVDIINSNAADLLNLLNDIIDVSILESGELTINKQNVAVHDLVSDVVNVFAMDGQCINNSELQLIHNAKEIEINTDPSRLKQILNNLLSNAIKFTSSGRIIIDYKLKGAELRFTISDTGIGMDEEQTERIFQRFYKIEESSDKLYGGNGIGLSICKSLVEALGGTIGVSSAPGEGSVFYFSIDK